MEQMLQQLMERLMANLAEMKANQEIHQEKAAVKVGDSQEELRKDFKANEAQTAANLSN
jgi:1,2-phenylacetyl-CoA epoxidase catalytic subunit